MQQDTQNTQKPLLADPDRFDVPKEATVEEYFRWLATRELTFRHPMIESLFQYYEALRPAPGIMPSRDDIILRDIVDHLPHIVLSEIVGDPRQGPESFLCRVFGNTCTDVFGYEMSGKLFSEYPVQSRMMRNYFVHLYVAETAKPLSIGGPLIGSEKDFLHTEAVFLPLSDDKKAVNMILCEMRFQGIS